MNRARTGTSAAAGFVRRIRDDARTDTRRYPFSLPVVAWLIRFATRASQCALDDHLVLSWGPRKPRSGFFLRAESYYNVASEIERPDQDPGSPPLLPDVGHRDQAGRHPGPCTVALEGRRLRRCPAAAHSGASGSSRARSSAVTSVNAR